jgi:hypothetical protein
MSTVPLATEAGDVSSINKRAVISRADLATVGFPVDADD